MVSFRSAASALVLLAGSASAFTVVPGKHQQHVVVAPTTSMLEIAGYSCISRRTFTSSSSSLFMGWGDDVTWEKSSIESIQIGNMSKTCSKVTLGISKEEATGYTIPGQYVQVRQGEDSKPSFFAIASAPPAASEEDDGETTGGSFEFLIKKTDDNGWITDREQAVDAVVEISAVMGKGYDLTNGLDSITAFDFPCQNVLMFAAGSGIAPIASAIESGLLKTNGTPGGSRTARLYYGVHSESDLCFVDRFPSWEESGVEVVPVVSHPSDTWNGRTGYVQNALEEDGVPIPRNTGALLCGMKGMTDAVTEILTKADVFEGRILQNF